MYAVNAYQWYAACCNQEQDDTLKYSMFNNTVHKHSHIKPFLIQSIHIAARETLTPKNKCKYDYKPINNS